MSLSVFLLSLLSVGIVSLALFRSLTVLCFTLELAVPFAGLALMWLKSRTPRCDSRDASTSRSLLPPTKFSTKQAYKPRGVASQKKGKIGAGWGGKQGVSRGCGFRHSLGLNAPCTVADLRSLRPKRRPGLDEPEERGEPGNWQGLVCA